MSSDSDEELLSLYLWKFQKNESLEKLILKKGAHGAFALTRELYEDRFTISVNSSINFSSMHSMTIHQIFFRIWPRRKPDQLHGTCDCASRFLCFLQKCRIGEWGADLPSPASQFAWFQSIPWLTKNCPALCCVNCVTCASMCARPW